MSPGERLPTDPSRIMWGLGGLGAIPIRNTCLYPLAEDRAEPEHTFSLCLGLGGLSEPKALDQRQLEPDPWHNIGLSQWARGHHTPWALTNSPSIQGLGVPSVAPIYEHVALSATPLTKSRKWRDTTRQALHQFYGARGLLGLVSPLS